MQGVRKKLLWSVALVCLLGAVSGRPIGSQVLQNMVSSRARVYPQVATGVLAMREDTAGHIYILSNPAHSILIFDATGAQIGQIPAANSPVSSFSYAADFDVARNGNVAVIDRGANQIDVFGPDGAFKEKVTVFAPTSIVALSNNQFAVTTLRTEHPVEVIDENGRIVRGFGEAHPATNFQILQNEPTAPTGLADTARIVGDSADNVYFALMSTSDPQIRKYDRFGYASYAAAVPTPPDQVNVPDDRVEFGFNFRRLSRSDQFSTWTTVGTSGAVHFGASAGAGIAGLLSSGGHGSYGRGGGSGAMAGTITADTSLVQPTFGVHLGAGVGRGGRGGRGSANGSSSGDSSAVLQYQGNGDALSPDSTTDATDALSYQSSNTSYGNNPDLPPTLDYLIGNPSGLGRGGPGVGGFNSFFLGGLGPRPGGFNRPFLGDTAAMLHPGDTAGPGAPAAGAGTGTGTSGGATPGPAGSHDFGGRGRFGGSDITISGGVKLNLGRQTPVILPEKRLTAMGVDHQTQEVWAAIGPMIVHFDRDGNPLDTYYLRMTDGSLLQSTAIIIEPTRILVGSATGGIYEFDRPDKSTVRSVKASAVAPKTPAQ
jgi:hypothetical protein